MSGLKFHLSIPLKNLMFVILINLFILSSLEITGRILIWVIAENPKIFLYGITPSVRLDIVDLSDLDIDVFQYSTDKDARNSVKTVEAKFLTKQELWTFGGSTTQGYICPSGQSSWPEKLESLDTRFAVKNYGKVGTNSDYAFIELVKAIEAGGRPDIVLWSNRYNEVDVIFMGLTRNYDRLKDLLLLTTKGSKDSFIIFIHRLHKSLYERSVAYKLVTVAYSRILLRNGIKPTPIKEPTKYDYQLVLENYRLNTVDAINYTVSRGIQFVIVLLPKREDLNNSYDADRRNFEKEFIDQASKLADLKDGVALIHTGKSYFDEVGDLSQFCDNAHWNSTGHETLARIISRDLVSVVY